MGMLSEEEAQETVCHLLDSSQNSVSHARMDMYFEKRHWGSS